MLLAAMGATATLISANTETPSIRAVATTTVRPVPTRVAMAFSGSR